MSRGHLQGFAQQGGHTVVVGGNNSTTKFEESYPGCTVTVYLAGTTTTATIYSDMAGTSKSNPFTADATTAYWDFYAESTARYDVKFSGTGIGTAFTLPDLRVGSDPTTVVNVKDYGAVGDGSTDDTTAIRNAFSVLAGDNGYAEVYFPPGTYKLTGTITLNSRSDYRITGAGMYNSILSISTGSGPILDVLIGTEKRDIEVRDLGFTSTNGPSHTAINADGTGVSDTLAIERCRFVGLAGLFVGGYSGSATIGSPTNVRVEGCVFQGLGRTVSSAIQAGSVKQMVVRGNEFRYQYSGILVETAFGDPTQEPGEYVQVVDNYFDGGWYTQVADFSGSTGVTYTANSVTDSGTTFSDIDTGAYVRALVPYFTTSHTASFSGTKVTDSSGSFFSWNVRKGAILRTGSAFGIVEGVESATVLWVEEWLSNSDRTPVLVPSTGTYTLYNVLVGGQVTSMSTHTLSFSRNWRDLDGTESTPASGTLYEAQKRIGNHFVALGTSAQRCLVDRNRVRRAYADQIACNGTYCRITNNTVEWGQDMGITIEDCASNIVANNTVLHQGVGCIIVENAKNITVAGNYCADATALGDFGTNGACIRGEDATGVLITGNRCERTALFPSTNLRHAILVRSNLYTSDDGVVIGNIASGFSSTYPQFVARGSNAHRNQLLDNSGGASASEDSAVDTVIRTSAAGATISPTQPRVVAYLSSTTTTIGATLPWAVPFDSNSTEVSVGSMHSTATNTTRFTAPADGIYLALGRFAFTANSSGLQRQAFLKKNGTAWIAVTYFPVANGVWPVSVVLAELVQMSAGDYLEFYVGHDATNTVTLSGGAAYITAGMLAKLW